jgi:hypothetical protein
MRKRSEIVPKQGSDYRAERNPDNSGQRSAPKYARPIDLGRTLGIHVTHLRIINLDSFRLPQRE